MEKQRILKFFRTKNSRISLIEFGKHDLKRAKEVFKDIVFSSGIYIIEWTNDSDKNSLYIGESDNVWQRVQNHISSKSHLHQKENFNGVADRVIIILSSDAFNELTKNELHWFESKLIEEFKNLGQWDKVNSSQGVTKPVNTITASLLIEEFESIKKALYFVGKNYFINSLSEKESNNIIENHDKLTSKWITVFPVVNKKRKVKVHNGKFEFSIDLGVIKTFAGTIFEGKVEGASVNFENFNYTLNKYSKYLNVELNELGEYNIQVLRDVTMKPSTIGRFIRAGVNAGWPYWVNAKHKSILEVYRK